MNKGREMPVLTLKEKIYHLQGQIDRMFHQQPFCPGCTKCALERQMRVLIGQHEPTPGATTQPAQAPHLMLSRAQLLQMVVDAYEACRSESMCCPWCSGRVGYKEEWHDALCRWPAVAQETGYRKEE